MQLSYAITWHVTEEEDATLCRALTLAVQQGDEPARGLLTARMGPSSVGKVLVVPPPSMAEPSARSQVVAGNEPVASHLGPMLPNEPDATDGKWI